MRTFENSLSEGKFVRSPRCLSCLVKDQVATITPEAEAGPRSIGTMSIVAEVVAEVVVRRIAVVMEGTEDIVAGAAAGGGRMNQVQGEDQGLPLGVIMEVRAVETTMGTTRDKRDELSRNGR